MKKGLLTAAPLCAVAALGAFAQAQLSTADLLRLAEIQSRIEKPATERAPMRMPALTERNEVELLVRFDDDEALDAIVGNGGNVVTRLTSHAAVVSVPVGMAVDVAASAGVKSASLSMPMRRANMAARAASKVDDVFSGVELPQGYKGEGVVVGLFDTGIDPNHIAFLDENGENRVKRVWDYSGQSSNYTEYGGGNRAVSSFTTDSREESHGTHVLGIMAGSFADSEDADNDYRGMAPGAEIVAACGEGYDAQILGGMANVAAYAKAEGKPCVINLSFGDNIGPHDGSDDFTATLNEIATENDAVICMAAGNERDQSISFIKTLTESDSELKTLIAASDMGISSYGSRCQGIGQVQVWGEDDTPFEVRLEIISRTDYETPKYTLEIPEGNQSTYVVSGDAYQYYLGSYPGKLLEDEEVFNDIYSGSTYYFTGSYMGGVRGVNAANGRYYADMNVYLAASTQSLANNNYVCLRVNGQPGKKIFVYCDGYYINFDDKNIPGMETFTGAGTNSNIGSGENTICVGSYVSGNVSGSLYPNGQVGAVSYFSSFGETPDGRVLPDVCAPGQTIISACNTYLSGYYTSYYPTHYTYKDSNKSYKWTSCAGTSQASPHMAGIAALWLSANPSLTHEEVKAIARETAAAPTVDGDGWGAGMVDAYAGIKRAISMSSVENVYDRVEEGIMIKACGGNSYELFAPGQTEIAVSLFDMSGVAVKKVVSSGDTMMFSADGVAPGVYILSVSAPRASRTVKIVVK